MHAVNRPTTSSTSTSARSARMAKVLRAAVLFIAGVVIALTASLHQQVSFDVMLVLATLTLIGIATIVEYLANRGTAESWWIAARAIVAFGAAGALLAITDTIGLALVIALWAALTAVITLMRLVRGVQPRRVALPSLLLSIALAVLVILVAQDPVAVTGFFGAYAILRGVFLGISAFEAAPEVQPPTPNADTVER